MLWTVLGMRLRPVLIVTMSLMLVISGVFTVRSVMSGSQDLSSQELGMRMSWVEACMGGPSAVNKATGTDFGNRPNSRLLCALEAFGKPQTMGDVSSMVKAVMSTAKENDAVRPACHDLLHEVGVNAWKVAKEGSLVEENFACGMGYYHGLMSEALLGEQERLNSIDSLVEFCKEMVQVDGQIDSGKNYQCSHGVGHAIGGVVTDLETSLPLCDRVVLFDAERDRRLCFTGALNQFVIMNPLETPDPEVAVARCAPFDGQRRTDCYSFSIYNVRNTPEVLKAYCGSLTEEFARNGCWRGVGMFESHMVIFAGDKTIGARLLKDPSEFANYMVDACTGDPTANCVSQLSAEAAEQVLNPDLMGQICVELRTSAMRSECLGVVTAMKSVHTL